MKEYNLSGEYIKVDGNKIGLYKIFSGINLVEIPKLRASGRIPLSVAGIMQRKLELRDSPKRIRNAWLKTDFNTSTLDVMPSRNRLDEKRMIILPYGNSYELSKAGEMVMPWFNRGEKTSDGEINLDKDNRYEELKSLSPDDGVIKYSTKEMRLFSGVEYLGEKLSKKKALDSPYWKILLQHPDFVPKKLAIDGLHKEAIKFIFSEYQQVSGEDTAMRTTINCSREFAQAIVWKIYNLDNENSADAWLFFKNDKGNIAGVLSNNNFLNVKTYKTADLQKFDKAMKGLEKTLHPNIVNPIFNLRKKL